MNAFLGRLKLKHFVLPLAFVGLSLVFFQTQTQAEAPLQIQAPVVINEKLVDFMGSSTIQFWDSMAKDFPQIEAVNLGIWGSDFSDLLSVLPVYLNDHPAKRFVIYSGDNDIANGSTPDQVLAKFTAVTELIHASVPEAQIFVISIKPCPVPDRRVHIPDIAKANNLIRTYTESKKLMTYVDVFSQMLTPEGEPRPELFREDGLHLNEQGYALWTKILSPYLL